ncbi:Transmembrane protease serine 9-like protein [Leptotrombidium deliense]|uniref:Transmembrane protease serine 9-like protein n=1 Tax=Leptotrombidium deliense TaxID=299467 RepID=A0A443SK02_9ACAR|nr:Transmembrane protease serine 9-like protein [Leptotrombidium deliense]
MFLWFCFILCSALKFSSQQLTGLQTTPKISDDCVCGVENPREKVVGGAELSWPNKYPWLVSLAFLNGTHFCGASIINKNYLMTAAHCFESIKAPDFLASFAAHNVTGFTNRFPVAEVISHKNYTRTDIGLFFDIALIRMKEPIKFSRNVQPVCLPKKSFKEFNNLFVAGWGYISPAGPTSDVAKELSLPPVTNEKCYDFHGDIITPYQLCAGGIVSYGIGCARPGYYGVYSRVSMFLDWIYNNTQDSSYCLPRSEKPQVSTPLVPELTTAPPIITTTSSSKPISPPIGVNENNCGIEGNSGVKYPWLAAIFYNEGYFGTGVLITKKLMLTTGLNLMLLKNMKKLNPQNLRAVFGENGATRKIASIEFHPMFARKNVYDNNFAILELNDTSSENSIPICLPQLNTRLFDRTQLKTLSWDFHNSQFELKEGMVEIVNRIRCAKERRWITGSMICGKSTSTTDTHLGGTGGPGMLRFKERWYLGTLVLTVDSSNNIPVVFSDVRHAVGWIYRKMKQ